VPKLGMEAVRREQVIEAARKCIVDKGVANLSVKDIALAAGVSTGIIYHYFKNKEDVLLRVLRESFRKSYDQVMATVEPIKPPGEKLFKYIENLNQVPRDNPDFFVLLLNYLGQAKSHEPVQEIVRGFIRNVASYVEDLVALGVAEDVFARDKADHLPEMIVALGLGLGIMWTIEPGLFDLERMGRSFRELIGGYIT